MNYFSKTVSNQIQKFLLYSLMDFLMVPINRVGMKWKNIFRVPAFNPNILALLQSWIAGDHSADRIAVFPEIYHLVKRCFWKLSEILEPH